MLGVLFSLLIVLPATAQEIAPPDPSQYSLTEVVSGLARPIYLTNAGDGSNRLFVLEQAGRIMLVADGAVQSIPFLDISDIVSQEILTSYSEQGLLGLAFHPNYAENGQFFVHYSDINGDTVIARYQVSPDNPNTADPTSAEVIFTHPQPYRNHNGGQIEFGPDGYLYIALGDGGSQGDPENNAQNPASLLGKILRVDVDSDSPYGIPADNPIATVNPELAPEIWALGLRNPYRFSFDSATGDLYIADVGQNQWEEINFQEAGSAGGQNYGWRVFEASQPYSGEADPGGTILPVAEYNHSSGCSVTGGYVYRGASLPALQGVYLFGDWCSGNMWATYPDADGAWQTIEFMTGTGMAISAFGEDDSSELYVLDYGGRILKLTASQ
jgi:glucose/arabinose dehydrogenase